MKTTPEILSELAALGCPLSLRTFERQRRALAIQPVGAVRTCPLRFADDTALRIAAIRGYSTAEASAAAVVNPAASQLATPQLVNMATLKRVKKGGRR